MKDLVKWFDNLQLLVKVLFCLPCLDILWVVYRLCKSIDKKDTLQIVLAVVLIVIGLPWLWLVDLIFVLFKGSVWWF